MVDDDPDSLELITSLLTDADYDVHSVSNASAGKNALAEDAFQLVVTDLYLGDDALGYEVADAAAELRTPVPVVLVTGRPSFENARDALRSRICEFVVKPFHGSDLVAACQRSIDQAEIRRQWISDKYLSRLFVAADHDEDEDQEFLAEVCACGGATGAW